MMKPSAKLYKKKAPKNGREKGPMTKVQASKQPKRGRQGGKGPTKNRTLHQSHEAYQLKREEVNLIKLQA
jgi:hypothetical protein